MKFDKKRFLRNTHYLANEKKMKIGDLEKNAGVSVGYLSRLGKEDNKSIPGVEVLLSFSNLLEVGIDALVNSDLTALTSTEKFLCNFLDGLLSKTNSFEYIWEIEKLEQLNSIGLDVNGIPEHPLYRTNSSCYDTSVSVAEYDSLFHRGEKIDLCGDIVKVLINAGVWTYIAKVTLSTGELSLSNIEYELYFVQGSSIEPVCSSTMGNGIFNNKLATLYLAARESGKHIKISNNAKNIINDFMSGVVYSDDELPF